MPTYVLEGNGRAVFPAKPVVVSMTISGGSGSADLVALIGGVPATDLIRPTPNLIILPRITGPTVLRIQPPAGRTEFADGIEIHLSLSVEDRSDPDADRAVIGPIAVGGETQLDVVSIDSSPEGIVLAALRSRPDEDLGEIANLARGVTRTALGVDQLPDTAQLDLRIAVDPSASMMALVDDGSLREVCELIVGVGSVVAPHSPPKFCIASGASAWVEVPGHVDVAESVLTALRGSPLSVGFASSAIPMPLGVGGPVLLVVISDGIPSDWSTNEHVEAVRRHLVVAGQSMLDPQDRTRGAADVTVVAATSDASPSLSRDAITQAVRSIIAASHATTDPEAVV